LKKHNTPWEYWISRELGDYSKYDEWLDKIVNRYGLKERRRTDDLVNVRTFLCRTWYQMPNRFGTYSNTTKLAKSVGLSKHSSVIHLVSRRKDPESYKEVEKILAKELKSL